MGNTTSTEKNTEKNKRDSLNKLNIVAFNYIINSNLNNLDNAEHCNELVILTSDIIDKAFNSQQVEYIYQKTQGNRDVNKKTKDFLVYFNDKSMSKFKKYSAISNKKEMCYSIGKFYVKITHVLHAIATALDHQTSLCHKRFAAIRYIDQVVPNNNSGVINIQGNFDPVYKPSTDEVLKTEKKAPITVPQPAVSQPAVPQPAVSQPVVPQPAVSQPVVPQPVVPQPVVPQPVVVSQGMVREVKAPQALISPPLEVNKSTNNLPVVEMYGGDIDKFSGDGINLGNEISIKKLDILYDLNNPDNYKDKNKKELTKLGVEIFKQYEVDLLEFYKAYSSQNDLKKLPENIKHFSDIKMKKSENETKTHNYYIEKNKISSCMTKLGNLLSSMEHNIMTNELELFTELKKIMIYEAIPRKSVEGRETQKRHIEIHPDLNDKKLTTEIIPNIRKILIKLYSECQIDYNQILKQFEAIKINIQINRLDVRSKMW